MAQIALLVRLTETKLIVNLHGDCLDLSFPNLLPWGFRGRGLPTKDSFVGTPRSFEKSRSLCKVMKRAVSAIQKFCVTRRFVGVDRPSNARFIQRG